MLEVPLTALELEERGQTMAQLIKEHDRLEEKRKAEAKRMKDDVESVAMEIRRIGQIVEKRAEHRAIDCEWTQSGDVWFCHRLDTGEVVDSKPVTKGDKQMAFAGVEHDEDDDAGVPN